MHGHLIIMESYPFMDKTKIAVEIFDKFASEYHDKYMDVNLYSDGLDLFCGKIEKEDAAILDIACGPGNITRYLLSKRPGFKITGIDLSPNMIRLATINNPSAEFQLMDCRDIVKAGKRYNAIMCAFCLPYLSREECLQLVQDASRILVPNGIIYISTMEDDYSKSGFKKGSSGDELYIHYHQADYLTKALLDHHFRIIDIDRKIYPAQDGTITTDLVIIAGK